LQRISRNSDDFNIGMGEADIQIFQPSTAIESNYATGGFTRIARARLENRNVLFSLFGLCAILGAPGGYGE